MKLGMNSRYSLSRIKEQQINITGENVGEN
jgi:hypothetical protein